jgi:two-component system phosphate regulon sensor histidine kinase PhoR
MTRRPIELLALVTLGAAWGLFEGSPGLTFAGAACGAVVWSAWDAVRAARLLTWLNNFDLSSSPRLTGLWLELYDRSRKIFKKLEKQRLSSDIRLSNFLAAIQASPNGVVLLDDSGRIEWVNLTAANQLGVDPQRDIGQHVQNLVRSPVFSAYLANADFSAEIQINGVRASATHPSRISVQIHPYGSRRKLMLTRDVTAVELAEAMRKDFVANVSHEIRTPLTVLSGFVETLQTLPIQEPERNVYLGLMSQQALRMQSLVSDLLTLSRLEGSPAPGQGEWLDCQDLLAQALQEAKGLSLVISNPPHDIRSIEGPSLLVAGAKSELLSALSNLLSNAVRYTPDGGLICAGWRLKDGGAEFFVEDSGPGIAAEHLPRLTERFYRVDRSRSRETGGTGLGLAIVKHVAQRHGGHINIQSTIGKGSIFSIALPMSRVQAISKEETHLQPITPMPVIQALTENERD